MFKKITHILAILVGLSLLFGCQTPASSSSGGGGGGTTPPTTPATLTTLNYLSGSALPTAATPVWTSAGTIADPTTIWSTASGILSFATAAGADTSTYKIAPSDFSTSGKITAIFRIQSTNTANKGLDIMFTVGGAASGIVVKFILSTVTTTGFQLEKYDNTNSAKDTSVAVGDYNIFQVTIDYTSTSANVNVYLNGSDTPMANFTNISVTRTASSNYNTIMIGDNSTSNIYGCNIDYFAWTTDGIFKPSEAKAKLTSLAATLGTVY